MSEQDYYKILGLRYDATPEEVRTAYRKIARTSHPDVASTEKDREIFQQASEAYSTLSDITKRNAYNKAHGYPFVEFLDDETAAAADEEPESPAKPERGKLVSSISSSKDIWNKLRGGSASAEQRVTDKLAQVDPKEFVPKEDEEQVTAWGEHEDQAGRGPQSGKSVFGWLRRGRSDRNIEELKKSQDAQLRANNVAAVDEQNWTPDSSRKWRPPEENSSQSSSAVVEERFFQFRVSSYEAFLGTRRQVAFPSKEGDGFTRLNVKVPAGIQNGTKLQVSRGWERISIKVEVIEDRFYRVSGSDIWVFVPVLFHEAYRGVDISVLGPETSIISRLQGAERFLLQEQLGERGLTKAEGGKGDIFVQPYVVPANPPQELLEQMSAMGGAAAQSMAQNGRAKKLPNCGSTNVVVVTVSPKELFLGGKIVFGENGEESFEIPRGWAGGLLLSSAGREVMPFLLLGSGDRTELDETSKRWEALKLSCERSEMVS